MFQFRRTLDNFVKFAVVSEASAAVQSLGLTQGNFGAILRATENLFGPVASVSGFTLGGTEMVTALLTVVNGFSAHLNSVDSIEPFEVQARATQTPPPGSYTFHGAQRSRCGANLIVLDFGEIGPMREQLKALLGNASFEPGQEIPDSVKNAIMQGSIRNNIPFDGSWSSIVQIIQSSRPNDPGAVFVAYVQNPATGVRDVVVVGAEDQIVNGQTTSMGVMRPAGGGRLYFDLNQVPRPTNDDRLRGQNPSQFHRNTLVPVQQGVDLQRLNNQSFLPEHRPAVDQGALRRALASFDAGLADRISWEREQAGVILVERTASGLKPVGARFFTTVALGEEGDGRPTDGQLALVAGVEAAWAAGGDNAAVRARLVDVAARFDGVTADELTKAEAFATSAGVAVLARAYRGVTGAFVPFHTHLGHPASFGGLARYAPTAADLCSRQAPTDLTARTHGSDRPLPGLHLPRGTAA